MVDAARLYVENKRDGISYSALAQRYGLTRGQVAGMINRHKQRKTARIPSTEHLFQIDLGNAWVFDFADCLIVGDVQIPTTSYDWLRRVLDVGRRYLKAPRRLIVAGDLINADAFSGYESDEPVPGFSHEVQAGRAFFAEMLTVFDEVYWFVGNHERRVGKKTRAAITAPMLLSLLTHDPRVHISKWGHCIIRNPNGADWRITHARNYSVNALVVADTLAQKYQQNIIQHHEHHIGKTMDRFKRYTIVNNGGLFDQRSMAYAVLDDSKSPNMANGFTLMRRGYVDVLGPDGFTDWGRWLDTAHTLKIAA